MISIGFTGDFCPWMRVQDSFLNGNWEGMFDSVKPFFEQNDLNVIDLECPLTEGDNKLVKTGPHIKAHPSTVEILSHLNCSLVATANNHFKDYGEEGMKDSYTALSKHNIEWVGSGSNSQEASKTNFKTIKGKVFAFVNMAENEWSTTVNSEYGCHSLNVISAFNLIKEARLNADYVIMIVHGGHEHLEFPSPKMKERYRFFVDAGADAVVAHHTHIISGYETYNGKPIFYSLGNFCFDWEGLRNGTWNYGAILRLKFDQESISFEMDYVAQNMDEAGLRKLTREERTELNYKISEINRIIPDDDLLMERFETYVQSLTKIANARLQPYNSRLTIALFKRGLLPSLVSDEKKLLYTNLIRCEAHREVLLKVLKNNYQQ